MFTEYVEAAKYGNLLFCLYKLLRRLLNKVLYNVCVGENGKTVSSIAMNTMVSPACSCYLCGSLCSAVCSICEDIFVSSITMGNV